MRKNTVRRPGLADLDELRMIKHMIKIPEDPSEIEYLRIKKEIKHIKSRRPADLIGATMSCTIDTYNRIHREILSKGEESDFFSVNWKITG